MPIDFQHEDDSKNHDDNRICRVHDSRPEQHSNVAEIVGHARHQIAGPIFLIKRGRKYLEVMKQIITQLIFDVTGNTDDEPAHKEAENTLTNCESDDRQTVIDEFLTGNMYT